MKRCLTLVEEDAEGANAGWAFWINSCAKAVWQTMASASLHPSMQTPPQVAKTMAKSDLVEKFRLAAQLNGISWDDISIASTMEPSVASATLSQAGVEDEPDIDGDALSDRAIEELERELEAEMSRIAVGGGDVDTPTAAESIHPAQQAQPGQAAVPAPGAQLGGHPAQQAQLGQAAVPAQGAQLGGHPSQPAQPGQAAVPAQCAPVGGHPSQPAQPGQAAVPAQGAPVGGHPAQQAQPGQAAVPAQGAPVGSHPAQPAQPGQAAVPAQGAQLGGHPAQQAQPGQAAVPAQGAQLGGHPAQPAQPGQAAVPGQGAPVGGQPAQPAQPGQAAVPAQGAQAGGPPAQEAQPTLVVSGPPCSSWAPPAAPGIGGQIIPTPHTMFFRPASAVQPPAPEPSAGGQPAQQAQPGQVEAPAQGAPVGGHPAAGQAAVPAQGAPVGDQPAQQAQPGQAAVPAQGAQPAQPGQAAVPAQGAQPAQPGQAAAPAQGAQLGGHPAQPAQPGQAAVPAQGAQQAQPGQAAVPAQGAQVGGPPAQQADPGQVAVPALGAQPAQPGQAAVPAQGAQLGGHPAQPAQPGQAAVPGQGAPVGGQPAQPAQPGQAAVPVQAAGGNAQQAQPAHGVQALPGLVAAAANEAQANAEAERKKQLEAAGLATSSTHRSEYMAFLRAAKHPENLDPSIAAMFGDSNKRKDLFNTWLQHSRDFGKVQLELTRRNLQRQTAHANTVTWSRAQLEQCGRYTPEDINDLITRATAAQKFIDDPNFPGVERLRRYIIVDEVGQQQQRIREDVQELSNTGSDLSHAQAANLNDVLMDTANASVGAPDANQKGGKNGRGGKNGQGKGGKGKKGKGGAPAPTEAGDPATGSGDGSTPQETVTTPLQKAKALAKSVLKEAEDARTTCVSIEGLECSGQLRDALLQHATAMTELYRHLSKKVSDQINDESAYTALFDQASNYSAWYKARKKVANSMKAAATSS
eukprot:Skav213052  [mRNA]  locus=scaffold364:38558:43143:+ [translate_table: standard]